MLRRPRLPALLLLFALLSLSAEASAPPDGHDRRVAQASGPSVLAAEASRAATPEQLELLLQAARGGPVDVQRRAVRALGRLERSRFVPDLLSLLSSPHAPIRAEAANAVAQAAGQDAAAGAMARTVLLGRLSAEKDGDVSAAMCEALGRLPLTTAEEAEPVERALVAEAGRVAVKGGVRVSPASPLIGVTLGWGGGKRTSTPAAIGALRGLESLTRLRRKFFKPASGTVEELRRLAVTAAGPARSLALLVLNNAAAADGQTVERAVRDEEVEVRRLAAASTAATRDQVGHALADPSPVVRYEALRAYGRRFQSQDGCSPVVAASGDRNPHVALLALDLLGNGCGGGEHVESTLLEAAEQGGRWHRVAHAIVSLARIAPERAAPLVRRSSTAEPWQLRMYAARAAAVLADGEMLERLAADVNANVKEAAIAGLSKTRQHAADAVYLQALTVDDGQLIITAAGALQGAPEREAAARALVAAFARLSVAGGDTSRDPRLALLDRLKELGSVETGAALAPALRDVDPVVAGRAAAVIAALSGRAAVAAPSARPSPPVPSPAEIDRLSKSVLRVTMQGGGSFDIRLLTEEAPLSCAAFARLAAAGYYNGLTFHRVIPNFVVQGGSPGANEFSGSRDFILDEVGRTTQARGTVGTSTRGRDTGDGQFYVNLVDDPRLDHDYTVFGQVVRGMEVVDAILEGDVMLRVEVVRK